MNNAATRKKAQLLFRKQPFLNIGRRVGDLDMALHDGHVNRHSLTWEAAQQDSACPQGKTVTSSDDATWDADPADDADRAGDAMDRAGDTEDPAELDRILQRLEDSLAERAAAGKPTTPFPQEQQPLWRTSPGTGRASRHRKRGILSSPDDERDPLSHKTQGPHPLGEETRALRAALCKVDAREADKLSTPLRLACHAINATLIVIALPVGALMMAYSILRGEDLNTSARMLAIIGTAVGVQHSPAGQQILALI